MTGCNRIYLALNAPWQTPVPRLSSPADIDIDFVLTRDRKYYRVTVCSVGSEYEGAFIRRSERISRNEYVSFKLNQKRLDTPELVDEWKRLKDKYPSIVAKAKKIEAEIIRRRPPCPDCSYPMVLRYSRKTGNSFWGCKNYPRCIGIVNLGVRTGDQFRRYVEEIKLLLYELGFSNEGNLVIDLDNVDPELSTRYAG